jgi:hypothetical protein
MIFSEFWKGEGKSKMDQTGFDDTTNLDVHSLIGLAQCQLALVLESATPTEPCVRAIDPSGNVYFFSTTSGKTWKRTTAGSYSLVNTNANGAHLGAQYFDGKVCYATATKLGYFDLATTWTDTYQTFSKTATARPMEELNGLLIIGNDYTLSTLDTSAVWTDNALDLPTNYDITALCAQGSDLLIGTSMGANVCQSKVFLWDTYSSSWTYEDDVYEVGVNCFVKIDNGVLAQCGTSGQLYSWNGSAMDRFKKIRGLTTGAGDQLSTVFKGKPLIANSNKIYSIHREDSSLEYAIVHEYTATGTTISSIVAQGSQLMVSHGSGVDKIDTNYATAILDCPEVSGASNVEVDYDSIPAGTIGISTKVDGGAWTAQTCTTDAIKKKVYFDGGLGDVNFLQARITLTPSTTNTPVIKRINYV